MFEVAAEETESRAAVAQQLAATLAHVVVGRVVPLLVLEGRAWDTGLENLWVHVDSEGAIDWVGVVDPTLRALPDDRTSTAERRCGGQRCARRHRRPAQRGGADDVGRTPQPPRPGAAVRQARRGQRRRPCPIASMWHIVGGAVVSAATQVPLLAGSSELTSMRRARRCSTPWSDSALPVRGTTRMTAGKALLN